MQPSRDGSRFFNGQPIPRGGLIANVRRSQLFDAWAGCTNEEDMGSVERDHRAIAVWIDANGASCQWCEQLLSVTRLKPSTISMNIETVTCPVCSGFLGGTVTRLLVQIGDWINVGTEVIEVEDELALILIPSNKTGRVVRIHLQPNDHIEWKSEILDVENASISSLSASD